MLILYTATQKTPMAHTQSNSEGELLIQPSPRLTFFGAYSTKRMSICDTLASVQKENYSGKLKPK